MTRRGRMTCTITASLYIHKVQITSTLLILYSQDDNITSDALTIYMNTRDSYHYKHARCNVMHRKCTVSVRGGNPPHTVNSPLQPTRRTTTEPCNENPYPSGTPRPSNAHPPGYNTDLIHTHTHTHKKKTRRYGSTRSSATCSAARQ